MRVEINMVIQKFFGLIKVDVSGDLNIKPRGGDFIKGQIKKRILGAIEDSGAKGSVTIDGERVDF